MTGSIKDIQNSLLELADSDYKAFQEKLMPTVPGERVLGVRTPKLRSLAKELSGSEVSRKFLLDLPHKYYEEDNLHAFLIEQIRDFDACCEALRTFLPFVDNWATCDSMRPKVFKKHPEGLLPFAFSLMQSKHSYTVRCGIGILMKFFLDEKFSPDILSCVAGIRSEEYYIKMMQAWFFQAALAKRWGETLPYLENGLLDKWVHNKAIQKCIESYRISEPQKSHLRALKIK